MKKEEDETKGRQHTLRKIEKREQHYRVEKKAVVVEAALDTALVVA